MVNPILINPIYIIGIGLGTAFLLGFLKKWKTVAFAVMLAALGVMTFISFQWLWAILFKGQAAQQVFTAGFKPPFSINLLMGKYEAFFTFFISFVGFLGGVYLFDTLKKQGTHAISVYLILIMGLNGIVMTRDIFNLFVFLEIASIATAGLIVLTADIKALSAGFKYMIATGLISGFLLLGIIFAYYFGGSLNIDSLIMANVVSMKGGILAFFLIVIALLLELKPFPANGWAIDVYHAAPSGINAVLSAASTGAAYWAMAKVLPIGGGHFYTIIALAGLVTFFGSNLMGLKQTNDKRLLGYSSVGQIGLLLVILGLSEFLGDKRDFIAMGIFLSHYLAKAVLFWIAGIVKAENIKEWAAIRKKPVLLVLFGTAVFALVGFPPFPSFFAKWELIMLLTRGHMFLWSGIILFASFIEGIYLFRWFGYALKLDHDELPEFKLPFYKVLPPIVFSVLLYAGGYYTGTLLEASKGLNYIPLAFILFIALIDFLPAWVKNTFSIAGVIAYIFYIFPQLEGDLFRMIFGGIFLVGAVITLFAGYYYKGRRAGFYPMALAMFAGLTLVVEATNLLELLYGWEIMSIGSYFLLIRGKKSMPHGYSYMLFSMGGAFAMMFGFSLAFASAGNISLDALSGITLFPTLAYSLMLLGFMTKTASLPMHIWLPGAHGEAVADIHFMASAILLKAGVFGIIIVLLGMGSDASYARNILFVLGWVGALSALIGNIAASFQESAKRLLAWSSIGQLGYIVFGLATMTHLGWLIALTYSLTHFLYKGVLFLIIGGIALRIGTPYMYKMGGLIKRMPFSFFAVLIAIITLSGVPPLVGYAAKWLTYNLLIENGFYYQGVVVMISGIIAFLYLFRLIHTIFLGQLKDNLRKVGEINIWLLIPVYSLLIAIMYLSMRPNTLLHPIGVMLEQYFPAGALNWSGTMATTPIGYFDGAMIMYVIGGIFVAIFLFFISFTRKKKLQQVKQFNIFYSGEAPSRPELVHFSYNFFAHYQKALGFLAMPLVTRFWDSVSEALHAVSDFFRRIYNGNGQSYAYHVVLYVVVVFIFTIGG
ncbi:MAG: proton-conducting transporter membrane subunit [Spirochaetota bacterium]|nr:proton-conducting transporter membrane subunit [Spirochaetota bacterium]